MAHCASLYLSLAPAKSDRVVSFSRTGTRLVRIRCVSSPSVDISKVASSVIKLASCPSKTRKWQWEFDGKSVNVYFEEHMEKSSENVKNILMVPTISDVSTVEEFRTVARDIVDREVAVNFRATIVDWPGLGFSDRPSINYNADVMEDFLVKLINSPESPVKSSESMLKCRWNRCRKRVSSGKICIVANITFSGKAVQAKNSKK